MSTEPTSALANPAALLQKHADALRAVTAVQHEILTKVAELREHAAEDIRQAEELERSLAPAPPPPPAPEAPKKAAPGEVQAAVLTFLVDRPRGSFSPQEIAQATGHRVKSVVAACRALAKSATIAVFPDGGYYAGGSVTHAPTPEAADPELVDALRDQLAARKPTPEAAAS